MRIFESHLKEKCFPAGTVSCDSVVTTLLVTLSQHFVARSKMSCADVSFQSYDNVAVRHCQELPQRCYNVAARLTR